MTKNETIKRIGAGLRVEIGAVAQAPLPAKMRELLARLEGVELPRPTPAEAPRSGAA